MSTHTHNNSSKEYLPEVGTLCELWWGGVFNDVVEVIQYRKHTIIFWSIKRDTVDSAEMPTAQLKPMSETGRNHLL